MSFTRGLSAVAIGSEYSDDERQFILACHARKLELQLLVLPWHEVLRVARSLGWRKVASPASIEGAAAFERAWDQMIEEIRP